MKPNELVCTDEIDAAEDRPEADGVPDESRRLALSVRRLRGVRTGVSAGNTTDRSWL